MLSLLLSTAVSNSNAAEQIVNLTVDYKNVSFTGDTARALAVNDQIPAPTLHFREGDHLTINVYNHLKENTAMHWHGIILPWQMDGVEGISQKPIPPNGVYHYHFVLRQSGTYWYHAHSDLQEQEGIYGAFIVDPAHPRIKADQDHVIVLSDWSNTPGLNILANLKKSGDYYSPRFPLQASLVKFVLDYWRASLTQRTQLIADYKMMQMMRMSIYDLSDVAYDAFLLNGQTKDHPWTAQVKVGDTVRLRFIAAASSTIYQVKIPGESMQVVQIDGNNIRPYKTKSFYISPGETYDVLVKIHHQQPSIIYAESLDTLGVAIGGLLTNPKQSIHDKNIEAFPEPKPATQSMMGDMHHMMTDMDMSSMRHSTSMEMRCDSSSPKLSTGTKYQHLVAAVKTNDPNKPIQQTIRMQLSGYMHRFIWFINGVPEYLAKPILIKPNKRYRFIFTNDSMMHHPMHIHGHWFILRNGHGSYDPLLHTLDVPPGATVVADLDTDASGQWFFHCHHLYHMMTGMSRIFQYETLLALAKNQIKPLNQVKSTGFINRPIVQKDEVLPLEKPLIQHPMAHLMGLYLANWLELGFDPAHDLKTLNYQAFYGSDYNKISLRSHDLEYEKNHVTQANVDLFYWRPLNEFWATSGGINYVYRPTAHPYWQPGFAIEGEMPFFIETNLHLYYHKGSVILTAEFDRDTQITNNFLIRLGLDNTIATKTVAEDEIGVGQNSLRYLIRPYYRISPAVNLFFELSHEQHYAALKRILNNENERTQQNIAMFGATFLF